MKPSLDALFPLSRSGAHLQSLLDDISKMNASTLGPVSTACPYVGLGLELSS